jgi:hypothetical protein
VVHVVNATGQRWCVYSGLLWMASLGIGIVLIAGLVPPPAPGLGTQEIARFYVENATRIEVGLVVAILCSAIQFPYPVAVFLQLRRAEGPVAPFAYAQLASGLVGPLLLIFPLFAMAAAAYRADSRDPKIIEALSDLGWLSFVGAGCPVILQVLIIGIAVLRDHGERPVFPRWVGYLNIWSALLFLPGPLVICFTNGPFAWNGVIAFWVPLVVLGIWYVVMSLVLLRAIEDQEATEGATSDGAAPVRASSDAAAAETIDAFQSAPVVRPQS